MTKIERMPNGYVIPENLGKRVSAKELHPHVQSFIQEQLAKNPNITDTELQPLVSNYIDTITKNKKIGSAKTVEMASLSETINSVKQNLAKKPPVISQKVPVTEIPSEVLRANSNMPLVTEPVERVKPVLESTEEYVSSKKKKLQKKQNEIQSKNEKQLARRSNGKTARNAKIVQEKAKYSTANSQIMSREAERIYQQINRIQTPKFKDARESAKVFVKNGYAPLSSANVSADVFIQNGQTWTEKAFDFAEKLQVNAEKSVKPEVKEVIQQVVKEVPKEKIVEKEVVKEVIKEVPKNNKLAMAGTAVAGGLLAWIGSKFAGAKQSA